MCEKDLLFLYCHSTLLDSILFHSNETVTSAEVLMQVTLFDEFKLWGNATLFYLIILQICLNVLKLLMLLCVFARLVLGTCS